jgi:homoaconitase/3-isopropylmalate dehydratase large subunit
MVLQVGMEVQHHHTVQVDMVVDMVDLHMVEDMVDHHMVVGMDHHMVEDMDHMAEVMDHMVEDMDPHMVEAMEDLDIINTRINIRNLWILINSNNHKILTTHSNRALLPPS